MPPKQSVGAPLNRHGSRCVCGFYRQQHLDEQTDPPSGTEVCTNVTCHECPRHDEREQSLAQARFAQNGWSCSSCQMLLVVWRAGRYVLKMDGTLETDGKPVCVNIGCERSPYRQESRPSDDLTVVDTLP